MQALGTHEHTWADAFQHEALLYAGLDEFVGGSVAFLREGLEREEPMLVAVPGERLRALRAELDGTGEVLYLDMEEIGRNPAHIIPAWREFLDAHGGGTQPVRGIGEPIWAGRSADELIECQRHEALLNVAFADSGSWRLLCPYDTTALPGEVIDEAVRSHPWVSKAGAGRWASEHCRPLDEMAGPFSAPLPPVPPGAITLEFGLDELPAVRNLIDRVASSAGLDRARTDDFVLASHEILTNSIRHGGGRGTVHVWDDGSKMCCEVADRGRIASALVGRQRPREDEPGGRGVWMANQLCDLVQIRTTDAGNVVRLSTTL